MKKIVTMQLLPLWLLAIFLFASKPVGAQSYTYSEATPKVGIIKQIGCGTGNKADKAQIQVIHDGVGYSYNFGANATDISNNTAWVPAGARTIVVSKGGTTYNLPITVPAKVTPSFTPVITYNCNGTADVRLTNNQGTYNYTYTYGGSTHNSPYFRGLAVGQHTITVKYTATTTTRDIVFYDDFGVKPTGGDKAVRSKYAISTMNFAPLNGTQVQPDGTIIVGQRLTNDACYTVATKADADTEGSTGVWLYPNDKDGNANGRYLYYDAGTINQNLYTRKAKVTPNTPVNFSAYLFNAVHTSYSAGNSVKVSLDIYANETDAENHTNALFVSYPYNVPAADPSDPNKWHPINVTANIGGGYSELVFVVRMYGSSDGGAGNDIALDNILVTQPTTTCEQTVAVPVNITGNAYSTTVTYNCAANNATVVVTPSVTTGYTYTYKLDNGVAGSVNTFNNVAVGVHTLTVTSRYTGATVKEIFKEDFGTGAPYSLPETVVPKDFVCKDVLYGFPADILPEGHYQVANRENLTKNTGWSWVNPKDHTNSGDSKGRYLAFNYGANGGKVFYQQDIKVEANKPVTVKYYLYSLNAGGTPPTIKAVLVNKANSAVIYTSTPYNVPANTSDTDWKEVTFTFTPNVSDLQLRLINDNNNVGSNDFVIDDILVTQAYETCASTITATVAPKVTQAFAGVTKLIGCGTGASVNKAEVTIANVQGGTAYEYNFDGTWTTTNIGWLPAGTHTVSVRAAGTGNSCQYDMSVTVPAALAQPTIKTDVFYACDGKAILNIGVANPDPSLTYLYSLDGAAYTTTYLYTNISTGTHTVSVQYEYRNAPSPVMLLKETFGSGPRTSLPATTTPMPFGLGVGAYEVTNPTQYNATYTPMAGGAGYGKSMLSLTCAPNHVWVPVPDHTSGGTDTQGRFFLTNAQAVLSDGDVFYKKKVTGIAPNSEIKWEFFILNLFREDEKMGGSQNAIKPNIRVVLVANDNTVIASKNTGEVPNSICGAGLNNWHKYEGTFNSGTHTEFTIEFRSNGSSSHAWGNDFCIDDITVYQVPKACGQVVSTTQIVTANSQDIPAFTVSKTYDCATGKGALTVTPTATTGFTYTYTLGSTTYTSTTATFTGLNLEQTYTVSVSYQAVSNTITLLNEDFGVGTTATDAVKSPYIGEDWYFNKNTTESYSTSNGKGQSKVHLANKYLDNQEYTIAPEFILNSNSNDWMKPVDKSGNANGRKLFVDGHATLTTEANLYLREIGVLPNQPLTFTTDFFNVISLAKTALANNPIVQPQVRLQLYESEKAFKDGNAPLKQTNIYHVPAGSTTTTADWKTQTLTLSSTEVGNRTKLFAVIKMYNLQHSGHDLAVDNIVITQKLPACTTSVTATLTKGDVATPTLTLPANLTVVCSAPTASATISSWIASAVATSTCGTATVTHNYSYPSNLCNVGGAVTVTFSTTDPFGNVVTATRVISFATMTLTVTPTTLSVPNGALGGTTSSVVPNITLGGVASPSTNSVTITFSGLPTGVTSTTGGRLVVAPNTPAGTHTITYRVCETAGNNNCKTVNTILVIGAATPTVSTETFTASTTTATVVPGVIGNILTNATVGTQSATVGVGGNVTITLTHTPTTPNAPVLDPSTGNVRVSGNTPPGVYTITYNLCSAVSTCVPGVATVTVPQLKPYVPNTTITHSGTTTTTRNILDGATINGGTQSATVGVGGTVSITNVTNPTPQTPGALVPTLNPLTGIVTVPPTTPSGVYTISYTVCTTATPTNCTTGVTTVVVGNVTPTVVPDGFTASTTTATVVPGVIGNVLTNDRVGTQSATTGVGGNVTINVTHTPTRPNAPVLDPSTGNVTVGGNTPAGVYTISYQVCSGAACTPATVTVTVPQLKPYVPNTTITHSGTTTTTRNILDGATVNGGTQSATVGVGGTVSITNVTNPTPQTPGALVPTLNPLTGIVTVPPTTPSGVYTISYTVCTTATPTNCTTGVTTVVVGNVTPTVVPDGFTASTTTATVVPGVIGNVLTNDRVGTQSATTGVGGNVTINVTHTPTRPNAPVLDPSTGNVTVGGNTPAGVYTISYQVCSGAACTPATVTVTVPQLKPYVPNTTITHSGTTTTTRNILDGATVNGGTQSATVGVGGTVSITNVTNPTPQTPGALVPTLNPLTGIVTVPPTTPSGVYTISYTVCTTATPTNCTTGVTTVVVGNVTPTVVPDGFTASTTTATVVPGVIGNVLTNDRVGTQSATTGVGGNVTINVTHTPTRPNAPVLDPSTGNVTVGGNTPAGVYTISYQVCSGAACTPATVTVTVPQLKPYVPNTTITHSGTTTTTRNILDGATVNGGTQSATVGVGGTVSITNVTNPTPQTPGALVPTLNPLTGIVTVPPTTPSGVYTISYTVCTTATPTNCTTGVTTVVVGNVTPTVVPEATNVTAHTRVNTPVNIGVTSSTTVTVSIPSQPANGTAVDNGDGTITYTPNNGFKGIDSFEYRLCNASGCHTATISVRVTNELVIYTGVSVGGDKNNHFHIEGIENYPNNIVRIYNRWGVKVFEVSGYNNTTKVFKGVSDARATLEASDNLPQGTYYYIIEYHDEANKKQTEVGWLYLKRN